MTRFAKRFVLKREIGSGGMARVFLARDEVLERFVAIKILNPAHGGTEIGDRFRREGRTAASLSHPNIVPVYGAGESEYEGREVSYIVMEYVPGGDLKALIDEKGPLPGARLARLGAEVSSGLAHAHERGVIHRDIKPHNVLIDSYGHPKLADFGIARALDSSLATQTGSYLGTALYSSPEQLQGEKVTPKSDVYSLGVTLYQAAVGEAPFTGSPIEVATQHINKTPPAPTVLGASLSDEAEALIFDCLNKDPDLRPTAEEVHERLLDVAAEARSVETPSPVPPPVEPSEKAEQAHVRSPEEDPPTKPSPGGRRGGSRRRRGPVILAAAALLLVLLGVGAYAAVRGSETFGIAQTPQEESQPVSSLQDAEEQYAQPEEGSEEQASTGGGEEEDTADNSSSGGSSSEEDPARVVEEFYQTAVDRDFGRHSGTMTPQWRQANFPSQGQFEGTYDTLQSIEWLEGPTTVNVSGNTATVTGVTRARHTDRTERNTGTWTLVYQNGEWRISGWQVGNLSTEYL